MTSDRRDHFQPGCLLLDERDQDGREDPVLAEQLMNGRALLVSQLAELPRLVEDERVRGELVGLRVAQVRGNLPDQRRDVVQQRPRRKDLVRGDRQQLVQAIEPARGERLVRLAHSRAYPVAEISGNGDGHDACWGG